MHQYTLSSENTLGNLQRSKFHPPVMMHVHETVNFPPDPRHDGAEDLRRTLERRDAYHPFPPNLHSSFSHFTSNFPFSFAFKAVRWACEGGRGVLLIVTLFDPRL